MTTLWQMLVALLPSVGVGFLFYKVLKTILEGDRRERAAYARWQAEQDAARADDHGDSPSATFNGSATS